MAPQKALFAVIETLQDTVGGLAHQQHVLTRRHIDIVRDPPDKASALESRCATREPSSADEIFLSSFKRPCQS